MVVDFLRSTWGTLDFVRAINPDRTGDLGEMQEVAVWARYTVTPRTAAAQYRYFLEHVDVRHTLPLIQAPTHVVQVADSFFLPSAHGPQLAERVAGATYVEIPGGSLDASSPNLNIVARRDRRALDRPSSTDIEVDRIHSTTVLFTDIVGSTERAAAMGDRDWRALLDRSRSREPYTNSSRDFKGREINTTGDGFVMSFDGPARAIQSRDDLQATGEFGIELRAGLHTGECEVRGDDLGGLAVHIAATRRCLRRAR